MSETDQHDEDLDQELVELVSYLDGELGPDQMTLIEQQLLTDPEMRSHADIMSRTWALLDNIDEESASETFTKDTMASIQLEAVNQPTAAARPGGVRRFGQTLIQSRVVPAFVLGVVGGIAGLVIGEKLTVARAERNSETEVNRVIIEDIDYLPYVNRYRNVRSAEDLRNVELKEVE